MNSSGSAAASRPATPQWRWLLARGDVWEAAQKQRLHALSLIPLVRNYGTRLKLTELADGCERVNLQKQGVNDAMMAELVAPLLACNTTTRSLNLSYTNLADDGVDALCEALRMNTALTHLVMVGIRSMSVKAVRSLIEAIRRWNVTVIHLECDFLPGQPHREVKPLWDKIEARNRLGRGRSEALFLSAVKESEVSRIVLMAEWARCRARRRALPAAAVAASTGSGTRAVWGQLPRSVLAEVFKQLFPYGPVPAAARSDLARSQCFRASRRKAEAEGRVAHINRTVLDLEAKLTEMRKQLAQAKLDVERRNAALDVAERQLLASRRAEANCARVAQATYSVAGH